MEQAVVFENGRGRRLFGIVHEPEPGGASGLGIVMLNPGIKYRVAPNRLNVKLARELCRRGHAVLRFDPEGIGDSEGELPAGTPVAELWGLIQRGRFVEDTCAANDYLAVRYGFSRFVLMGNCGGAITALLAGAADERVRGLCLVDIPVYLWSSRKSFADTAVRGGERAEALFWAYLRRLFSPRSWYRFLTLQTNYSSLFRIISLKARGKRHRSGSGRDAAALDEVIRRNQLNPEFFRSFDRCAARGVSINFVSAGNDPGLETFSTFFVEGHLGGADAMNPGVTTLVIPGANHVYSLGEWQRALADAVLAWTATQVAGMKE